MLSPSESCAAMEMPLYIQLSVGSPVADTTLVPANALANTVRWKVKTLVAFMNFS